MFKKGEVIRDVNQLLECRTDGSGYVFYKDRPLAFSFIGHMNLFTVIGGIAGERFRKAIRKGV